MRKVVKGELEKNDNPEVLSRFSKVCVQNQLHKELSEIRTH